MTNRGQEAVLKVDIKQSPFIAPSVIPAGTKVEILRVIEDDSFYSGVGYVIFWEEDCYVRVIDANRVQIV